MLIKPRRQCIYVKLFLFHANMISAKFLLGKCASWRRALNRCNKFKFWNCESVLYMKSRNMLLKLIHFTPNWSYTQWQQEGKGAECPVDRKEFVTKSRKRAENGLKSVKGEKNRERKGESWEISFILPLQTNRAGYTPVYTFSHTTCHRDIKDKLTTQGSSSS